MHIGELHPWPQDISIERLKDDESPGKDAVNDMLQQPPPFASQLAAAASSRELKIEASAEEVQPWRPAQVGYTRVRRS